MLKALCKLKKGGFKGGEKGEGDKLCIGILGIPDC